MKPRSPLFSSLAACLVLAAGARADVLAGRVVDAFGNGVAGVNIVVDNPNGSDPTVSNGGTNAGGFFSATVTPAGVYDITFEPPPPPVTTHLVREIQAVVVVGTKNLGDVALPPGVALSGRVLGPTGSPVAGIDLDVIAGGTNVDLRMDNTNLAGQFLFASPAGPIELRIDPSNVSTTIAPEYLELVLSGSTALGDLQLQTGYVVSALVRRAANNTPVQGVDVDVHDSLSGRKLYTPGDDTDVNGFVDFVVPAGTYDIEFCPPFANRLVAGVLADRVVAGTTFLGTQLLQPGVVLSGITRRPNGTAVSGVDVDVRLAGTPTSVVLCGDNSGANGAYAVVVPTGSFDVTFTPPYAEPLGSRTYASVVVAGDTTRNASLPACPFFTTVGPNIAGTGGLVPQISATGGAPRIGNPDYTLRLDNARGGARALLRVNFQPAGAPPGPFFQSQAIVPLGGASGVAGAGSASVPMPVTGNPAFAGFTLRARFIVLDPAAPGGRAMSDELQATFCL